MTDRKYTVDMKRRGVLPRFLTPWKYEKKDLNLEEVSARILRRKSRVMGVSQKSDSTIVNCQIFPDWSAEQWDRYNVQSSIERVSNPFFASNDPSDYVSYRIRPSVDIRFSDRR